MIYFFQSRAERADVFGRTQKILISFCGLPLPASTSPEKAGRGGGLFSVPREGQHSFSIVKVELEFVPEICTWMSLSIPP